MFAPFLAVGAILIKGVETARRSNKKILFLPALTYKFIVLRRTLHIIVAKDKSFPIKPPHTTYCHSSFWRFQETFANEYSPLILIGACMQLMNLFKIINIFFHRFYSQLIWLILICFANQLLTLSKLGQRESFRLIQEHPHLSSVTVRWYTKGDNLIPISLATNPVILSFLPHYMWPNFTNSWQIYITKKTRLKNSALYARTMPTRRQRRQDEKTTMKPW